MLLYLTCLWGLGSEWCITEWDRGGTLVWHLQMYEMMVAKGGVVNTFTYATMLQACGLKGRALAEVAMVLYAKMAAASPQGVPPVLSGQLIEVRQLRRYRDRGTC
jgi:hypothetical protein